MHQTFLELCLSYLVPLKMYILLAVVSCLFLVHLRVRRSAPKNLPPGPWGLPIFGYLPFLSINEPHLQLEKLRKKHGDVFGLYLGSKYAVFIGDVMKCKDGFNLEEFSGRPDGAFPMSQKAIHFGALNGREWKERRKCTVQALRQLGIGTQMIQNVSREQMNLAVKRFEAEIGSSPVGKDVNLRSVLAYTTTSVVLKFVCGNAFSPSHKTYKIIESFLKFFAENGSAISLDMVLPWAKPILNLTTYSKDTLKIFSDTEEIIRSEVELHLKQRPETPKDLIDFYVKHYASENPSQITIDNICVDAQVMVFVGADTVRITTEWFLLCLAEHPKIQERVFQEVHETLGATGVVNYEDRHLFPYTEAAILESFRYKSLTPVNPYHSALQDTKFCGFDIPKDSLVFALLWTLHNDPAHWSHPNEFHPEHFLTPDQSKVRIPDAFLPFAPGKRTCLGDKVALTECYLFCVTMVQNFKILPPDGGIRMEGKLRVNMEPCYPIVKLVKRRGL